MAVSRKAISNLVCAVICMFAWIDYVHGDDALSFKLVSTELPKKIKWTAVTASSGVVYIAGHGINTGVHCLYRSANDEGWDTVPIEVPAKPYRSSVWISKVVVQGKNIALLLANYNPNHADDPLAPSPDTPTDYVISIFNGSQWSSIAAPVLGHVLASDLVIESNGTVHAAFVWETEPNKVGAASWTFKNGAWMTERIGRVGQVPRRLSMTGENVWAHVTWNRSNLTSFLCIKSNWDLEVATASTSDSNIATLSVSTEHPYKVMGVNRLSDTKAAFLVAAENWEDPSEFIVVDLSPASKAEFKRFAGPAAPAYVQRVRHDPNVLLGCVIRSGALTPFVLSEDGIDMRPSMSLELQEKSKIWDVVFDETGTVFVLRYMRNNDK